MEPMLFILHGNGPYPNRGCEAILEATIAILREEFGACRFVNAPGAFDAPESFPKDMPDIVHVARRPVRQIVRWTAPWFVYRFRKLVGRRVHEPFEAFLPRAAAVLTLGGDNYSMDYGYPTYFFNAIDIAREHGKPIVLWGASVGPFHKDPAFEKWATQKLKKVPLICARESETIAYLASLGVTENVRAVSDPAFALEPEPVDLEKEGLQFLKQPCVGLNLSPLIGRYYKGGMSWTDVAAACVKAVAKTADLPVVLIPHVFTKAWGDLDFIGQVLARISELRDRVFWISTPYRAAQMKWLISRCRWFIGARTHATIAAMSSNVPTLSIGYSIKARGINKDIFGHSDWVIPADTLRPEGLADDLRRLMAADASVRGRLADVMPAYKARARQATKYVREILAQGASR